MSKAISKLLLWIKSPQEAYARRLLRQRDEAWAQIDHYRRLAGMGLGEFCKELEDTDEDNEC